MFSNRSKGLFCAVLAAITYGMNPLFGLPLFAEGVSTPEVLCYRFALGAIMLGAVMLCRRSRFHLEWKQLLLVIGGGLLLASSSLSLFQSFRLVDSGLAATVLFIYPVMVALLMRLFFREKISRAAAGNMVLALLGVALCCQVGEGKFSWYGIIMALLSALFYALYMVLIKFRQLRDVEPDTLTFYAMLAGLPLFISVAVNGEGLHFFASWKVFGLSLGLAFFPSFLSFSLMAVAIRYIGATRTAILGALEPVTALIIGITLFREKLSLLQICGTILILAAVSMVIILNDRHKAAS